MLELPFSACRRAPLAAVVAAMFATASSCACASSFPVFTCDDSAGAVNTVGTLRYAIANAVSGDTIDLSAIPAFKSACPTGTITLQSGELRVTQSSLVLQGSSVSPVTIAAGDKNTNPSRVLNHTGTGTLSLNYLTLVNGKYAAEETRGGCILSQGTVALNHSIVSGCTAKQTQGPKTNALARGGGIYAANNVVLQHSTVSGNTVDASADSNSYAARGGGIYTHNNLVAVYSTIDGNRAIASVRESSGGAAWVQSSLDLENTTVSNNYGQQTGGIYQRLGSGYSVTISNSTFSGNSAPVAKFGVGGLSIAATPTVSIANSTFALNRGYFGGIWSNATLRLKSSLIADNTGYTADLYIGRGSTITGSNNLVVGTNLTSPPAGVIAIKENPKIAPLSNHGGPTRTHALLPSSPAVGVGSNSGTESFTYDQRGFGFFRSITPTPLANVTDIGAYQRQLLDDEIYYDGFAPLPDN